MKQTLSILKQVSVIIGNIAIIVGGIDSIFDKYNESNENE
jgi:hypothetical protein|tara:strand:- start:1001 stop:1120 length:120 start_codon:yes stop_codon:yes gene_type:complete